MSQAIDETYVALAQSVMCCNALLFFTPFFFLTELDHVVLLWRMVPNCVSAVILAVILRTSRRRACLTWTYLFASETALVINSPVIQYVGSYVYMNAAGVLMLIVGNAFCVLLVMCEVEQCTNMHASRPTRAMTMTRPLASAPLQSTMQREPTEEAARSSIVPHESIECVICLQSIDTPRDLEALPCAHVFHATCIRRWLNMREACPVCNTDVGDALAA